MAPFLPFLEARERFLPVTQAALQDKMLRDERLSGPERDQLRQLFAMIADRFHWESRGTLEHLKALYEPLDPDRESLSIVSAPAADAPGPKDFARAWEQLLLGANYVEMPRQQILACVEYQSETGLAVRASLADYAQLRVLYRGVRHQQRTFRPWLTPWRRCTETVHVLSRVAMLVRLASPHDQPVFLKLFKNVVAEDLEMLLPHVKIRMRWLDQVKIGSSVAGGVATAAWKAFSAAMLSPWLFLLILFGLAGATLRSVFSFFSSKTRYLHLLTSRLYFQNLANNTSLLAHLIDEAEAEECKELLLAYYILYLERHRDYTQQELDRRVEQWLQSKFGLNVDYEVSDAIRKLQEKDLLVRRPLAASRSTCAGDVLKVYDLPSALRRLDEAWDNHWCFDRSRSPIEDRLADGSWPPLAAPSAPRPAAESPVRCTDGGQASPSARPHRLQPSTHAPQIPANRR